TLRAGQAILVGILLAAAILALERSGDRAFRAEDSRIGDAGAPPAAASAANLYKWKDDSGVWNYTDQPPVDRPFERITGTPNVNTVPTVVPDLGLAEPSAP